MELHEHDVAIVKAVLKGNIDAFDDIVNRHVDPFRRYVRHWDNENHGILTGVAAVIDNNSLLLTSLHGRGHTIDISGLGAVSIPINVPVRIIGIPLEDGSFHACAVLPVQFRGGFSRQELYFNRADEINQGSERSTLCEDILTPFY